MIKRNTPRQPEKIEKQIRILEQRIVNAPQKQRYGIIGKITQLNKELHESKQFKLEAQ